ncbi:MAG: hypothetical protein WDO71_18895 [Bacteroidota bacterium]
MMNEFDEVKLLPGNAEGNHTVNELLTNLNELPPGYAINKHFKNLLLSSSLISSIRSRLFTIYAGVDYI